MGKILAALLPHAARQLGAAGAGSDPYGHRSGHGSLLHVRCGWAEISTYRELRIAKTSSCGRLQLDFLRFDVRQVLQNGMKSGLSGIAFVLRIILCFDREWDIINSIPPAGRRTGNGGGLEWNGLAAFPFRGLFQREMPQLGCACGKAYQ